MAHPHGGRMLIYILFVLAVSLSTVAWARHSDSRIRQVQRETCDLLERVTNNQVFVLRHHYAASTPEEREEILRRIRGIRVTIRDCD